MGENRKTLKACESVGRKSYGGVGRGSSQPTVGAAGAARKQTTTLLFSCWILDEDEVVFQVNARSISSLHPPLLFSSQTTHSHTQHSTSADGRSLFYFTYFPITLKAFLLHFIQPFILVFFSSFLSFLFNIRVGAGLDLEWDRFISIPFKRHRDESSEEWRKAYK
jgi:hypothetical protein